MAASRLSDAFLASAYAMSQRLNISLPDLLVVMAAESTLDPAAHNPGGATGLIQIMDLPGVGWNGGWQAFAALSAEEQLPYVERFLAPYKNANLNTHQRVHQALMAPATLGDGSAPDYVVYSASGSRWGGRERSYYEGNKSLDREGKGYITVEDLRTFDLRASGNTILRDAYARLPVMYPELGPRIASLLTEFRTTPSRLPVPASSSIRNLVALGAMGTLTWWFVKKRRG